MHFIKQQKDKKDITNRTFIEPRKIIIRTIKPLIIRLMLTINPSLLNLFPYNLTISNLSSGTNTKQSLNIMQLTCC